MARKEKKIHYIYKITCVVTGRWYIGMHSTININDNYLGSGTTLRHSVSKIGKMFNVKQETISKIKRGLTHKDFFTRFLSTPHQ